MRYIDDFHFFFSIHITFLISPVSHFFIPMRQIPHIILLESVGRDKFTWSNSQQSSNECLSLITHNAFLLPNYTSRLVYKLVRLYPTSRRAGPRSLMALRQVRFSTHKKICDEPGSLASPVFFFFFFCFCFFFSQSNTYFVAGKETPA